MPFWKYRGPDYSLIFRLLFKFVLKIFYGTIVVENVDLIPETGRPWCAFSPCVFALSLPVALEHCLCKPQQFVDRCTVRRQCPYAISSITEPKPSCNFYSDPRALLTSRSVYNSNHDNFSDAICFV